MGLADCAGRRRRSYKENINQDLSEASNPAAKTHCDPAVAAAERDGDPENAEQEVTADQQHSNRPELGSDQRGDDDQEFDDINSIVVRSLHSRWLLTHRADLNDLTPRDVILEKRQFIDSDLDSRASQWSLLNEGAAAAKPRLTCLPVRRIWHSRVCDLLLSGPSPTDAMLGASSTRPA